MGAAPGLGSNSLERSQGKLQALSSVSGSGLKCWGVGIKGSPGLTRDCPRTDLLGKAGVSKIFFPLLDSDLRERR